MRPSTRSRPGIAGDLLVTVDGAGASHGLIEHLTALGSRPGHRVHYSID